MFNIWYQLDGNIVQIRNENYLKAHLIRVFLILNISHCTYNYSVKIPGYQPGAAGLFNGVMI